MIYVIFFFCSCS